MSPPTHTHTLSDTDTPFTVEGVNCHLHSTLLAVADPSLKQGSQSDSLSFCPPWADKSFTTICFLMRLDDLSEVIGQPCSKGRPFKLWRSTQRLGNYKSKTRRRIGERQNDWHSHYPDEFAK
uniref:Uncharacterized protein n=1 Tax=Pseudonaja textilis TaxID=8673 RepID=A0A670Y1K9_PSETE